MMKKVTLTFSVKELTGDPDEPKEEITHRVDALVSEEILWRGALDLSLIEGMVVDLTRVMVDELVRQMCLINFDIVRVEDTKQ